MSVLVLIGDARERLKELPDKSVHCVVTSPPYYGLRDYGTGTWQGGSMECDHVLGEVRTGAGMKALGARYRGGGKKAAKPKKLLAKHVCRKCGAVRMDAQIGLEETPEAYVQSLVELFALIRQKLRDDGTVWLNIGDSYASSGGMGRGGNHARIGRSHQQRNVRPGLINRSKRGDGRWGGGNVPAGGSIKKKDLIGIPWMVAFALRAAGWYLRQDNIWNKPNPMPESVEDRCTKSHEYLFLLSKSGRPTIWRARDTGEWSNSPDHSERIPNPTKNERVKARRPTVRRWRAFDYYFDQDAIAEEAIWKPGGTHDDVPQGGFEDKGVIPNPGNSQRSFRAIRETKNKRSVWTVATVPFAERHFATFPPKLVEPCILASCPEGGTVLDPFGGAGTTALVAERHQRNSILCELSADFAQLAVNRIQADGALFLDLRVDTGQSEEKEAA